MGGNEKSACVPPTGLAALRVPVSQTSLQSGDLTLCEQVIRVHRHTSRVAAGDKSFRIY